MLGVMTTTTRRAVAAPPRLLLVAHGTRSSAGRRELCRLLLETRKRLAGEVDGAVDCRLAWVDVQSPGPDRVLADGSPTVVVPAFLARGHHVTEDVGGACRRAPGPVSPAPHLGSEPEVVRALVQRLAEAGATGAFGADAVVLGAAGSKDASSLAETRALAAALGDLLRVPVRALDAMLTSQRLSSPPPTVVSSKPLIHPTRRGTAPPMTSWVSGSISRRCTSTGAWRGS